MEKKIGFKIIKEHSRHCHALVAVADGKWNTPWWLPGKYVTRDSLGRKNHGCYMWLILECNCMSCDASAIVKVDDILSLLPPI
jgi:hypothetical protein